MKAVGMIVLVACAGCVRGGFTTDSGDNRDKDAASNDQGRADGSSSREDTSAGGWSADYFLFNSSDTCNGALSLDLSPLQEPSQTISLIVDTTGAFADYNFTGSLGAPDLVVLFSNAPEMLSWSCQGGGLLTLASFNGLPSCPGAPASVGTFNCSGGEQSFAVPVPSGVFVVGRDPAAGPALLTLQQAPSPAY